MDLLRATGSLFYNSTFPYSYRIDNLVRTGTVSLKYFGIHDYRRIAPHGHLISTASTSIFASVRATINAILKLQPTNNDVIPGVWMVNVFSPLIAGSHVGIC